MKIAYRFNKKIEKKRKKHLLNLQTTKKKQNLSFHFFFIRKEI